MNDGQFKEVAVDKILVSLDCLLDTRIGVIAQKYPEKVSKLLSGRSYFERIQDRFDGIEHEEFVELYKNRNVETLKCSMMTNATLLMGTLVKTSANQVLSGSAPVRMIFDINIYPYVLDEDERNDLLGVLEFHVGDAPEYNIVSIPNEFLTPVICKSQYAVLVMYDFPDWMRMHADAFKEFRMPDLLIYAPQLLEKLPTPEENKKLLEMNLDPFEASRLAASPAFSIRFLTIDVFSIRNAVEDAKRLMMEASEVSEEELANVPEK